MPHAERIEILTSLHCSENGLGEAGIEKLRARYGFNEIPERRESAFMVFLSQFNDAMVYVLLAAAAVSLIVPYFEHGSMHSSEITNTVAILCIVFFNALLGFAQERRADNAIAQLRKLSTSAVKVRRDGRVMQIASRELLPGDLMLAEAGDRIAADARIVASASAEADESSLTGESLPVPKKALTVADVGYDFSPGMLYSGTLLTRGCAEAAVMATALKTEIGKITSMVMLLKPPPTPLQLELRKTGRRIGLIVVVLCAAIFTFGLVRGMDPLALFFTAVSLAVAAVPEGLPAIVTICLAIGVQRMSKNRALIRKLDAVETLGSVTLICADKTGTMTENRMKVTEVWAMNGIDPKRLAEAAASCNRAELPDIGDPTEVALLVYAEGLRVPRLPIEEEEVPFTSEAKYMVTTHQVGERTIRFLKGAPEVIARFVPSAASELLARSTDYSAMGLRVLAVARDEGRGVEALGLLAMMDPPRKGVAAAIADALSAGIRTIMITGDHPVTALTIAKSVGIKSEGCIEGVELDSMSPADLQKKLKTFSVFARVQPAHKVRILEALQADGEIVAMSGDGVNDAPALKRAHVGVGMGQRGTDVARESAAMVLTDDNYASIVAAVAEGRRIYDNIKKFVVFLMRSNVGEVLTVSIAMFAGLPMPLQPLHILWINLVTDSFPALALAAEPAERGIMKRMPRSRTDGMFAGEWFLMAVTGLLNAALSLGVFLTARRMFPDDLILAQSACLTTTIVYQLFLAFSTRTTRIAFTESPAVNPWLILGAGASFVLQLLLLLTPLSGIFNVKPIPLVLWEEVFGGAIVAFAVFEFLKWAQSKSRR